MAILICLFLATLCVINKVRFIALLLCEASLYWFYLCNSEGRRDAIPQDRREARWPWLCLIQIQVYHWNGVLLFFPPLQSTNKCSQLRAFDFMQPRTPPIKRQFKGGPIFFVLPFSSSMLCALWSFCCRLCDCMLAFDV